MAPLGPDLPSLYLSGDYSDCTLISQEGEELRAHRIVVGQHQRFKDLIDVAEGPEFRIRLDEPTKVVQRVLEWMYGIEWPYVGGDGSTTAAGTGAGVKLLQIMGACRAAEKVSRISTLSRESWLTSCSNTISPSLRTMHMLWWAR